MGAPNRSKMAAAHLLSLQVVEKATAAVREEARRRAMRGQKLGLVAQRSLYSDVSLQTALELAQGNHSLAATVLGVTRTTMYRMVKPNSILAQNDPSLIQDTTPPSLIQDTTPPPHTIQRPKSLPGASQVAKRADGWQLSDLDSEAVEICQGLMVSVLKNIPGCRLAFVSVPERERMLVSWALQVSQLHHLDLIPYQAIKHLAEWSQRDKAWRGRIVTGKALRKHWDELQAAYEAQRESFERRRSTG